MGYSTTVITRAGVYGRNSKGEAKSIADQLDLGLITVQEQGWTLAGKYSDDSSASRYRTKDRDEWTRLLADLAAGALDVLVLWKSARGSRDEVEWFLMLRRCRDRGIGVHVMADRRTYDPRVSRDWKTLAEDGVNSAYYSEELSENVRRGVRQAAIAGGVHGRIAFGYERHYHERTGRFTEQVPGANAPIVREIFDRLGLHCPISELERDFRKRDLTSPSGLEWKRNTIRTIATNVAYIGKRSHDGEIYDAGWPPLVDEELFWRVQEYLGRPERMKTKPGAAKYLLSYIAAAEPCGGLMKNIMRNRPGSGDRYGCERDGCVSIARSDADEMVEKLIVARLSRPDARDLFATDDTAARAAGAEAARYRTQLEEARRSFEAPDGISAEALARKERSLLPLIEDADKRKQASSRGVLDELVNADDVQATWDGLSTAARREVVPMLATVVIGPPSRRLSRHASALDRQEEAALRLGGSRWVGDTKTWGER